MAVAAPGTGREEQEARNAAAAAVMINRIMPQNAWLQLARKESLLFL